MVDVDVVAACCISRSEQELHKSGSSAEYSCISADDPSNLRKHVLHTVVSSVLPAYITSMKS